jgi:hypothetical protein
MPNAAVGHIPATIRADLGPINGFNGGMTMTKARSLITDRRHRALRLGDSFVNRLLRLDRCRATQQPLFMLFRTLPLRREA